MPLARSLALAALVLPALLPASAAAQRRYPRPDRVIIHTSGHADRGYFGDRRLSLVVGALNVEQPGDDTNFPMAALRAEWRLGRFVRSELGASFALGEFDA